MTLWVHKIYKSGNIVTDVTLTLALLVMSCDEVLFMQILEFAFEKSRKDNDNC